jgi:hypothetical protein
MKCQFFSILFFSFCLFAAGCSSQLSLREIPGVYIPTGASYRSDTLILYPYNPQLGKYTGRYHHRYIDSQHVARTFDSLYRVEDPSTESSDVHNPAGVFTVDITKWHSRAEPNGALPEGIIWSLWYEEPKHDSILLRPGFFWGKQGEPSFVKIAK